jgi:hypothetical protein
MFSCIFSLSPDKCRYSTCRIGSFAVYVSVVRHFRGKYHLHLHGHNNEFWDVKRLSPKLLTSVLNMGVICSTETPARSQNATRRNNPEWPACALTWPWQPTVFFLHQATTTSFHMHSNVLFINHPIIQRYSLWTTSSVIPHVSQIYAPQFMKCAIISQYQDVNLKLPPSHVVYLCDSH